MRMMMRRKAKTTRVRDMINDLMEVDEPTHATSDQVRADAMRVRDWIDQEIEES